jgi:flavin reductase (DIM6/NTAB) family NADH-FMN oxidoreductase RutF
MGEKIIDKTCMFNLSYGLFVLSAKDETKNNACIVNTVIQITEKPNRVLVAVNKLNYTHDLIVKNKKFMISVLTNEVPFSVFERFGFQSGKDIDKFKDFKEVAMGENKLPFLSKYANACIGATVVDMYDSESHTVFIAEVTEAKVLCKVPSITYAYYHAHTKPKIQVKPKSDKKTGKKMKRYVCKVCGFIYEGEELPEDYICPICKHGVDAFDLIEE